MDLKVSSRKYFLIMTTVALLAFTGCKGEKKQESAVQPEQAAPAGQMPADHPAVDQTTQDIAKAQHANIKTQKEVILKDEVRAKWKEVKLEITEGASNAKQTVAVKVGGDIQLNKAGVRLKVDAFVPDYAIADNRIESRSNEPNNPAVLIELLEGNKSIAKGWVFKEFPEFNSYTDDRFPVKLVGPGVEKAAAPAAKK
ncbi:MAG: hypothetical protein HY893_07585 [Deltaproteobacteria bacterium]|nr:hypothetical protein [Deltaproteobacteria bacterium]